MHAHGDRRCFSQREALSQVDAVRVPEEDAAYLPRVRVERVGGRPLPSVAFDVPPEARKVEGRIGGRVAARPQRPVVEHVHDVGCFEDAAARSVHQRRDLIAERRRERRDVHSERLFLLHGGLRHARLGRPLVHVEGGGRRAADLEDLDLRAAAHLQFHVEVHFDLDRLQALPRKRVLPRDASCERRSAADAELDVVGESPVFGEIAYLCSSRRVGEDVSVHVGRMVPVDVQPGKEFHARFRFRDGELIVGGYFRPASFRFAHPAEDRVAPEVDAVGEIEQHVVPRGRPGERRGSRLVAPCDLGAKVFRRAADGGGQLRLGFHYAEINPSLLLHAHRASEGALRLEGVGGLSGLRVALRVLDVQVVPARAVRHRSGSVRVDVLRRLVHEEERRDVVLQRDVRRVAQHHAVAVKIADEEMGALRKQHTGAETSFRNFFQRIALKTKKTSERTVPAPMDLMEQDHRVRSAFRHRRRVEGAGEAPRLQMGDGPVDLESIVAPILTGGSGGAVAFVVHRDEFRTLEGGASPSIGQKKLVLPVSVDVRYSRQYGALVPEELVGVSRFRGEGRSSFLDGHGEQADVSSEPVSGVPCNAEDLLPSVAFPVGEGDVELVRGVVCVAVGRDVERMHSEETEPQVLIRLEKRHHVLSRLRYVHHGDLVPAVPVGVAGRDAESGAPVYARYFACVRKLASNGIVESGDGGREKYRSVTIAGTDQDKFRGPIPVKIPRGGDEIID